MLELTPDEREYCQDITTQLLDRTLYECEELGLDSAAHANLAPLDSRRWKKLQSHPDVTLYADRSSNGAWSPVMHREDWAHPVALVAIGEFKYSLNDVLLALVTPDIATQRMRSVLLGRRPENNCKHQTLVRPSDEAPFQVLAVSRYVNTQHWPHTLLAGPREMVVAFGTGEVAASNGKRIGYEVMQTVSLNQTFPRSPALPRSQMIRARVFWEQPDGTVGMYGKTFADGISPIPDSVTQGMYCRAAMCIWKFVPLTLEVKKLRWCLKNRKVITPMLQRGTPMSGCAACGIIKFKSQAGNIGDAKKKAKNQCEFCETWLCGTSYCKTNCQLKMVSCSETKVYEQTLLLCPRCIAFVRSVPAIDIARFELAERKSRGGLPSWERDVYSPSPTTCSSTDYDP
ncbi:hypothetical protein PR003_g9218 [Phytophthora rubi]|uniref:FYVE-type domain-containing protein n=1 Tax=Phytophthora rubi TaxID=129364 RepID=A0A6A4FGX3_9STRA|nr:hypothetical protein PR002_g9051 [Phytophthora rubi]KAE9041272.1 hypothetical protein PR001_g6686 [Phytophthora rubi]KAE9342927.1 hypothetical protein PR003_g9218 [Phytophthora rubi]